MAATSGNHDHVLPPDHVYVEATKQVKGVEDMPKWENSEAYQEYLGFILAIGEAVRGKKIRDDDIQRSEVLKKVLEMLDVFSVWIDEIPLAEQQQRFGNKAYRDWHARLVQECKSQLEKVLEPAHHSCIDEVSVYLTDSFGNSTRIDYGTGHEMAFVMFLASLFKVGAFKTDHDEPAVGLVLFNRYMILVRKLQQVYRMEPAGSQGVWALDDFQFIPFAWGAAQLIDEQRIEPRAIPDYAKAEQLAPDNLFFGCIKYISEVKTGPFAEHSNQLWNVSGVPTWSKVYTGLIKMYRAEVLSKFPLIQHTFFGSIFTLEMAKDQRASKMAAMGPQRRRGPPGGIVPSVRMPPPSLPGSLVKREDP